MTNAKDTFYILLRTRLAALNPARTVVVRGVTRPGLLVTENELATSELIPDVFRMSWTKQAITAPGPLPPAAMICEIQYATAGSAVNGGMDRGRLLTQMDAELATALRTAPHCAPKMNYAAGSAGTGPVAMATNVFWSDVSFAPAKASVELMERVATVEVFSYEEAGE